MTPRGGGSPWRGGHGGHRSSPPRQLVPWLPLTMVEVVPQTPRSLSPRYHVLSPRLPLAGGYAVHAGAQQHAVQRHPQPQLFLTPLSPRFGTPPGSARGEPPPGHGGGEGYPALYSPRGHCGVSSVPACRPAAAGRSRRQNPLLSARPSPQASQNQLLASSNPLLGDLVTGQQEARRGSPSAPRGGQEERQERQRPAPEAFPAAGTSLVAVQEVLAPGPHYYESAEPCASRTHSGASHSTSRRPFGSESPSSVLADFSTPQTSVRIAAVAHTDASICGSPKREEDSASLTGSVCDRVEALSEKAQQLLQRMTVYVTPPIAGKASMPADSSSARSSRPPKAPSTAPQEEAAADGTSPDGRGQMSSRIATASIRALGTNGVNMMGSSLKEELDEIKFRVSRIELELEMARLRAEPEAKEEEGGGAAWDRGLAPVEELQQEMHAMHGQLSLLAQLAVVQMPVAKVQAWHPQQPPLQPPPAQRLGKCAAVEPLSLQDLLQTARPQHVSSGPVQGMPLQTRRQYSGSCTPEPANVRAGDSLIRSPMCRTFTSAIAATSRIRAPTILQVHVQSPPTSAQRFGGVELHLGTTSC